MCHVCWWPHKLISPLTLYHLNLYKDILWCLHLKEIV
jgi:hypothetical protein